MPLIHYILQNIGRTFSETPSGGMALAGNSDVTQTFCPSAEGGLITLGESAIVLSIVAEASGALGLAGQGDVAQSFGPIPDGGFLITGKARVGALVENFPTLHINATAEGGLTLSTTADLSTHYVIATGTLTLGGSAVENYATYHVSPEGGLQMSTGGIQIDFLGRLAITSAIHGEVAIFPAMNGILAVVPAIIGTATASPLLKAKPEVKPILTATVHI